MQELARQREQIQQQINDLKEQLETVDDQIFTQVKDRIRDEGSTTLEQDGVKLTVTVPVRVSWDEARLKEVANRISAGGDDPENYIKFKPSVSERDFKTWPEAVQKVFMPARTTKAGKRSITIKEVSG